MKRILTFVRRIHGHEMKIKSKIAAKSPILKSPVNNYKIKISMISTAIANGMKSSTCFNLCLAIMTRCDNLPIYVCTQCSWRGYARERARTGCSLSKSRRKLAGSCGRGIRPPLMVKVLVENPGA